MGGQPRTPIERSPTLAATVLSIKLLSDPYCYSRPALPQPNVDDVAYPSFYRNRLRRVKKRLPTPLFPLLCFRATLLFTRR